MSEPITALPRPPLPQAALGSFLRASRDHVVRSLRGMCRFPMRPLGRQDEAALAHERGVEERFETGQSNLFGLSIDPSRYLGNPDHESDEILYRLFILGDCVHEAPVAATMGADWIADALDVKLLRRPLRNQLQAAFRLVVQKDQLFVTDRYSSDRDMVYLSHDSLFMADYLGAALAERHDFDHVVDFCCGSGILGIHAAALGGGLALRGIDINPRAVVMARLNSHINGIEASWMEGPCEAMEIPPGSHVVANPPFIFTPAAGPWHSDGGACGLEVTLHLLDLLNAESATVNSFSLLTQSALFGADEEPRLVTLCADRFPRLDLNVENVGDMPVPAKFADFHLSQGVRGFQQLVVTGSPGSGRITWQPRNRFFPDVCFG